jgi:hypothetical protein
MSKESIERCGRETNHALVKGTGFCRCTHVMFPDEEERPRCTNTRGGGGRTCSLDEGHKGAHVFECGR